jgi:hypothetical protein
MAKRPEYGCPILSPPGGSPASAGDAKKGKRPKNACGASCVKS